MRPPEAQPLSGFRRFEAFELEFHVSVGLNLVQLVTAQRGL